MISIHTDLRKNFVDVRDQARRATCLLFTASDLNSNANGCEELSVDYLSHYSYRNEAMPNLQNGFTYEAVSSAVSAPGQPLEIEYPYDYNDDLRPTYTPPACAGPLRKSTASNHSIETTAIIDTVNSGRALGLLLQITESFFQPDSQGCVEFNGAMVPMGTHAVICLGTGLNAVSNDRYLMIRNSWGMEWGFGGHAWISSEYLDKHLIHGFNY